MAMWKTVLCLALLAVVATQQVNGEKHVKVLTEENFDSVIAGSEFTLVEFFAPWCGHCKKLAPEYEKAAAKLAVDAPHVTLASVDVTEEKDLGERFEIKGFPTLKFFKKDGSASEYGGGRTEPEIVNWLKKKTGPAAKAIDSVEAAEEAANAAEVFVLGIFADANAAEKDVYMGVAFDNEEVPFGVSSSAEVAAHYKVTAPATIVLKKFDELRGDFTGSYEKEELKKFVAVQSVPSIMYFDQKAAQLIFGGETPCVMLLRDIETESGKAADAALKAAASALKGRVLISYSGLTESLEKRLLGFIGVAESEAPAIRLVKPGSKAVLKYSLEGAITQESIEKLVADFEAGNLKPVMKSEEVPEQKAGEVTVLVGKNFDDLVLNSDKDVLVEFYAPWCGHCKQLAPIYDQLAAKMASVSTLTIAKFDATANEHEAVAVKGFPTIKFYPANDKKNPVEYNKGRDLEGFLDFLSENVVHKYELPADDDESEMPAKKAEPKEDL